MVVKRIAALPFKEYSILRTLRFRRHIRNWKANAYVYPRVHLGIHRGAEIIVCNGASLHMGCKWDLTRYFPSSIKIDANAALHISGAMDVYTDFEISVDEGATLYLGGGYINNGLQLYCFDHISIGNDVAIAENVTIRDSDNHKISPSESSIAEPITIEDHVWIGMNATILKGVTIGSGAVIGADSVVTQSIPANSLAVGAPAEVVKEDVSWS